MVCFIINYFLMAFNEILNLGLCMYNISDERIIMKFIWILIFINTIFCFLIFVIRTSRTKITSVENMKVFKLTLIWLALLFDIWTTESNIAIYGSIVTVSTRDFKVGFAKATILSNWFFLNFYSAYFNINICN